MGSASNSVLLRTPREGGAAAFDVRSADVEHLVRCRFDIVCFTETYGDRTEALISALRAAGTKTV